VAETSAYVLRECEVLATPWLLRMLEYHVRWQPGTLLKEQDSHDLEHQIMGHQGPVKKPRCNGTLATPWSLRMLDSMSGGNLDLY